MQQLSLRKIRMKKTLRAEMFLAEMDKVVPWQRLEKQLAAYYPKNTVFPLRLLLRI